MEDSRWLAHVAVCHGTTYTDEVVEESPARQHINQLSRTAVIRRDEHCVKRSTRRSARNGQRKIRTHQAVRHSLWMELCSPDELSTLLGAFNAFNARVLKEVGDQLSWA